MDDIKENYNTNKKRWDELADRHYQGGYQVEEFKRGRTSLFPIEEKEVGNVSEKTLLHLQCHFGMDSLSLARKGAIVTGVDFSPQAISYANRLKEELNIPATFIESNIFELKGKFPQPNTFDIVFTSHGTIVWLHDLMEWAKIIHYYLKPGGFFYIIDDHPFVQMLDDENPENKITFEYPYQTTNPVRFDSEYSYVELHDTLVNTEAYEWAHPISEIVNVLIKVGLTIEFIHEFSYTTWKRFSILEKREDLYYQFPSGFKSKYFPLMFSLKAYK